MRRLLLRRARLTPPSQKPRRIAVYVSSHGLGHAVRIAAVAQQLRRNLPVRLTVIAACDPRVWPASLAGVTDAWHPASCDAGVVQSDDVTVDLTATRAGLERWLTDLPAIVDREVRRLEGRFDLVLGDVPSPAFEAADRVEIPSVAVANFSWDWIYEQLGFAEAAAATSAGYSRAGLLLEAVPFGPMPAFPRRSNVGLVTREPSSSGEATRAALAIERSESVVLLAFQPSSAPALALPARRRGRTFLVPGAWPLDGSRGDVRALPDGLRFEDAIAASDVVVGKPGYGLLGDVEAAGARFLYVPRPGFPENAVLESHLHERDGTASISARHLASGAWEDALASIEAGAAPIPAKADGARRAAEEIAAVLGVDSVAQPQ